MKKFVLLLIIVIFLTGCKIDRIDNKSIEEVITIMFSQKIKNTNAIGRGYEYYLPLGVIRQSIDSYNEKLYSNGDIYYLFIDIVGYLNKNPVIEKDQSESLFYKEIDNNGFITIKKQDDKNYIKIYYNYAYIEAYVSDENLNMAVSNMISILKTMNFEDTILSLENQNEIISDYEETFNIKTSTGREEVNFLDYEEQYDKYTGPDFDIEENQEENTDLESDIITKEDNK